MKNIKISTKLIILIIATSIILAAMGIYALRNLKTVNTGIETMYTNRVIPLEQLKNVSDGYAVELVNALNKAERGIFTWSEAARNIEEAEKIKNKYWNAYLQTKIVGQEKALVDETKEIMRAKAEPAVNKALDILKKGRDSSTIIELQNYNKNILYQNIDPLTSKISQLIELQLTSSKTIIKNARNTYQITQESTWMFLIIGVLIGIFFSLFIIMSINRSLKEAIQAVLNLEKGNLTYQIKEISKDEIGVLLQNIKQTIERLREIVKNINIAGRNIGSASVEVSSSSQELSQGTSEQASSTEEVSSSMEEMAANIQQNTDNAAKAYEIAQKSSNSLRVGSQRIFGAINAMKQIAEKISIVNEIAFQTNILALNASVEAARAGEHGKGFSVVAEEVRNLAQSSKEAAKEISIVVQDGLKLADESNLILKEIMPKIEQTTLMVKEINYASKEQNSGVSQINNAIQDLNQVVQQGAASAEEMASSSEELNAQAEAMLNMMDYFKVDENNFNQMQELKRTNPGQNYTVKKTVIPTKQTSSAHINLNTDKLDNEFEKY